MARDDWRLALPLAPTTAATARLLARLYVLGPLELRDPHQALGLISSLAADADPNPNPDDVAILGIAQVRLGQHEQGLVTLQKVADAPAAQPLAQFFIAIAKWHRNLRDDARAWYGQAVTWLEQHPPVDPELRRVRDETAELLGIPRPAD